MLSSYTCAAFCPANVLIQAELQRVLYPVFVHTYLQMVQYGASHAAADLLKRYR